jgi:hypothetical protein
VSAIRVENNQTADSGIDGKLNNVTKGANAPQGRPAKEDAFALFMDADR